MDLNALLQPVVDFFSQGIGAVIARMLQAIFMVLYPANAPAAHI
ncbi:hypothetical protein [Corynebacterium kozikiae]|nr:hypothetical protein [Corynebacterium sp. 76QC2CO]MCQ9343054.1 hypothetical protein [Corynebacterium sp. 76QC2CO]